MVLGNTGRGAVSAPARLLPLLPPAWLLPVAGGLALRRGGHCLKTVGQLFRLRAQTGLVPGLPAPETAGLEVPAGSRPVEVDGAPAPSTNHAAEGGTDALAAGPVVGDRAEQRLLAAGHE